jgi:hypothetical protein
MRRPLAAVLALPLLVLAGCSGAGEGDIPATGPAPVTNPSVGAPAGGSAVAPPPVDPSVAAAGDRALSGNTKAICDQAARTSATFGETFIADLKLQIDAASRGPAAKAQAQQKIDRDVSSYSSALAGMADLADDKALKTALTQMGKQVQALKGDVTKLNADRMSELTATLDKACGR